MAAPQRQTETDRTRGRGRARGWLDDLAEGQDRPASAAEFDALPVKARKRIHDGTGKEAARILGAEIAGRMIRESGLTYREIEERHGFEKSALWDMVHGKAPTGPTLWKLFALADALGYRLDFTLEPAPRDET